MIVGGTVDLKTRDFLFSIAFGKWLLTSEGRLGGKSGKKPPKFSLESRRDKREAGKGLEPIISSIPFLEPGIRKVAGIAPIYGSIMHLHQITFALSILTTPASKEAQKNLIAHLGVPDSRILQDQLVQVGLADPDPFDAV